MREKILSIVVCTFLLLNFVHVEARSKTLKIGSMSPLTGPYATDGKDIRRGVETAIKVIEDEGGLPGFDKIEFFPQDTACDPRQAVSAAIELMDIEVNGVIGAYCSSSTVPASKVLNEGGIIMITPASTNPIVTDDGPDNMFRVSNRDDYTVKTAGNFLKNVLKAKKILIIDDGHEYSKEVSLEFEKYSKNK